MQNHTDVLIVGAGLGGLLAAATLIAERDTSNPSVRIIEASAKSGGRARTKKVEGSDLNLGAHALYKGGPLWDLLSRIGVTPDGRDPTKMRGAQPSGFYRGEVHPLPVSPMHMLTTPLLDWRGRKDIVRFFANVMSTKAMPDTLSVRSWLEEMNLSTDALAMAEGLSRLGSYSAQFDMLRANTARKMLARATRHGVLYLHHGWGALIDALETRVVSDGADILHETRARQLTRHEDGTFSVETSGDTYHSDAVILATPPRVAARLLGEDVKRWELTEARAAHLDLVLERLRALEHALFELVFHLTERFFSFDPLGDIADGDQGDALAIGQRERSRRDHRPDEVPLLVEELMVEALFFARRATLQVRARSLGPLLRHKVEELLSIHLFACVTEDG